MIKSIPAQTMIEELSKFNYFASNYENPVRRRPGSFAYELIQKDVARMLEQKSFVPQSDHIGAEQIFHFIDRFYFILRLERGKRSYRIEAVKTAFQFWLKKWISCWHYLNRVIDPVVDIDQLIHKLTSEDIEAVKRNMFSQKYPENIVTIFSGIYNFKLINDTISRLKRKGAEHIERLMLPIEQLNQLENVDEFLTEVKGNYQRFYEVFPEVYDEFVKTYFSLLFDDLCYYRDFDKEMFRLDYEQGTVFPPKVHFWEMCFVDTTLKEHKPVVLVKDLGEKSMPPMAFWEYESGAKPAGTDQRLYWFSSGNGKEINFSQDFLLHHSLFKLLRQRFREFFEKKLNNEGLSRVIL